MEAEGLVKRIPKLDNCWLAKTDPKDVARVESKTVICTENENETIPTPADGVEGMYSCLYTIDWVTHMSPHFAAGQFVP